MSQLLSMINASLTKVSRKPWDPGVPSVYVVGASVTNPAAPMTDSLWEIASFLNYDYFDKLPVKRTSIAPAATPYNVTYANVRAILNEANNEAGTGEFWGDQPVYAVRTDISAISTSLQPFRITYTPCFRGQGGTAVYGVGSIVDIGPPEGQQVFTQRQNVSVYWFPTRQQGNAPIYAPANFRGDGGGTFTGFPQPSDATDFITTSLGAGYQVAHTLYMRGHPDLDGLARLWNKLRIQHAGDASLGPVAWRALQQLKAGGQLSFDIGDDSPMKLLLDTVDQMRNSPAAL